MQTGIPCLLMRGGTSRGPFFLEADLPADSALRDQVLLAALGSPDRRQIDGLGGAHPLTSKVGIVGHGRDAGVDLDFLFAQVMVDEAKVDTTPNCGNMLAAVVPFALETGLVEPQGDTTTLRVLTRNTGMQCDVTVATPGGRLTYEGNARIDGVPGTAAPITINFLDTAGSVCSGLLPTGRVRDEISGLAVTCIDNGMPMVLIRAGDLGRSGYETVNELNADAELKARLETLRLEAGQRMGLGDVSGKTYPKMCLLAPPREGGSIATRTFIPHVCHDAIGVLAAVTVATACVLLGSVANELAATPSGSVKTVSVEHPSGEFSVELEVDPADPQKVTRAALLRTARLLMRGDVFVPGFDLERKNDLIIDCHGHYTTAPKALEEWRNRQIAGLGDPARAPKAEELRISDEDLRATIEANQLKKMKERGSDLTVFSPRASFMAHHIGDFATSSAWAAICNELCYRVSKLFPDHFIGAAMLPQSPGVPPETCIPELLRCAKEYGFVAVNLNPDPSGGHWREPPLFDRHWYPLYEKMAEYDLPAMIHVSTSCNPSFHTTGAHYLTNADTTAFMQCLTADLFKDFPTLRFVIPHGGGAVPYHWGRFRGLAQELKKPLLKDHLLNNIFFDTCVYHQAGIDLLTRVIPVENILFASEMIGAVRGVDPETGFHYDDTQRYVEASPNLSPGDRFKIYEGNARRVYPRLDAALKARGR